MTQSRRLPEIRVKLERVAPGERALPLDDPDNLGMRTKLGGEPDWIQGDDTPQCSSCGKAMTFVAQIDSIVQDNKLFPLGASPKGHQDYMFGDVGMIYVFWCFDCLETFVVQQDY